ncbi:hypothetical protein OPW41_18330 [Vibrio europaeus]|uniref:hypothetical protein n=1 Tax=Vibrio europaeus TaxID=300876 RepID=UPI00233F4354|nr:hypothetical protein [Vibrio europaeus]MDC5753862.1 hypothetical protein [Vibrio europaeus]MDC5776774.1 hypothetical protein [Vibrio europaeus]MDC5796790.1 hypothetical protein [Vibrio europaeus]MDC5801787.1 hypothetical protein [Vibrio europaeus]MDC5815760.1 hypothetical protein [Vibrio europaeus]
MEFQLQDGLALGKGDDAELQYEVEMRELSPKDVFDSQLAAETFGVVNGKAYSYVSDTEMGIELLRRQVVNVGCIQGPLSRSQLFSLSDTDFALVQEYGQKLDEKVNAIAAMEEAAERGRSEVAG